MLTSQGQAFRPQLAEANMIEWSPQPDITLHELALALPILIWAAGYTSIQRQAAIAALPPNVRRHFV